MENPSCQSFFSRFNAQRPAGPHLTSKRPPWSGLRQHEHPPRVPRQPAVPSLAPHGSAIHISLRCSRRFPHPRCGIWYPWLVSPLSADLLVWTRGARSPLHGRPSQGKAPPGALLCIPWRLSLAFLNQRFLVSDWGQWEL